MDTKSTGDILRAIREKRGLRAATLANALQVARSTVSRWESSRHPPSPSEVQRYCLACGATSGETVNAVLSLAGLQLIDPTIDIGLKGAA